MEIHIIPVEDVSSGDKFIIYRPLVGLAFVGNRAMVDLALALADEAEARHLSANGSGAAMEFLQTIGFLATDPTLLDPVGSAFRPTTAVLLLTNQCQLRCVYCYAAASALSRHDLSPELGYAAIDYVCQTAMELGQSHFDLSFHGGGEPTFAWKVLQACTDYARQKPLPARITLTSNAAWSSSQRDWIIANIDSLSISVDGTPETQNLQRPFVSGRGSSDIVMGNIKALDRHGIPYGLRLTATGPWKQIPEDMRFICRETRCQVMQIEPAFNSLPGGHGVPEAADCQAFAEAFLEAFEVAVRARRRLYYSGARPGVVTTKFCAAPYNALIVNADGNLVTCYEVDKKTHPLAGISTIGRIENRQVMIDEAARKRLHTLLDERRASCRGCFCYHTCAGDCYTRTFQSGPTGHLAHGPRCDMNRAITREMLLGFISGSRGVWLGLGHQPPANQISPVSEVAVS